MTKIKQFWREKIAEPLDELQERARQQWMTLAPRERMILSVLASVFSLLLAILLVKEAFTFFSRHEDQVAESLSQITEIQKLSAEISRQRDGLGQYERLLARRDQDFKLNTFLETEARKFGVTVEKISPTKARLQEGDPEQEWVEVRLGKETSLDNSLKFLKSLEEPIGVRLVDLQIKPQFTDPTKLEVIATVASLKEI